MASRSYGNSQGIARLLQAASELLRPPNISLGLPIPVPSCSSWLLPAPAGKLFDETLSNETKTSLEPSGEQASFNDFYTLKKK